MRHVPPLIAECILVGAVALATAWTWLTLTDTRTFTAGGILACTGISVAVAMTVEAAVKRLRRGRPRRAHARPTREAR